MGISVSTLTTLTLSSGSLGSLGDGVDDAVNAGSIADGVSGPAAMAVAAPLTIGAAPLAGMAVSSWVSEVLVINGSAAGGNKVKLWMQW
jgi:hypothetical protein